jgi:hypothetical protein
VERQGGDLSILTQYANLPLSPRTATLVEHFPCSGIEGPCAVHPSTSSAPVNDAGNRFCKGTTFALRPPPDGPDEWVPILPGGHPTPVSLLGWVSDSRQAGEDDGATHEFWQEHTDGRIWVDWDVFVHPIDPFRGLLATNTFMEVEFEYYPAQWLFVAYQGVPLSGDLYFASGR